MVTDLSNPFSTGAGGSNFEGKVQASFLASMIVGAPCPCVPSGAIKALRLQSKQAGYDTDDILVTVETTSKTEHRLLGQVKHAIAFTRSNEAFKQSLFGAWRDFRDPSRFDHDNDAIAFITGPQSAKVIGHIRPLLEWARYSANEVEFFSKVASRNFSSEAKREFIGIVRDILGAADAPPNDDDELWRFIRVLHLLTYDLDNEHSQDEARVVAMLGTAKAADSKQSVEGLWAQVLGLVGTLNQNAATVTFDGLADILTPELQEVFGHAPVVRRSPALVRLREHTDLALARISDAFIPGVSLGRIDVVEQALDLLARHQVLLLSGNAGIGKSVIAKRVLTRLDENVEVVFGFRMEEFDEPHLHQALTNMGVQEIWMSYPSGWR